MDNLGRLSIESTETKVPSRRIWRWRDVQQWRQTYDTMGIQTIREAFVAAVGRVGDADARIVFWDTT
jgi:hypothetical protein